MFTLWLGWHPLIEEASRTELRRSPRKEIVASEVSSRSWQHNSLRSSRKFWKDMLCILKDQNNNLQSQIKGIKKTWQGQSEFSSAKAVWILVYYQILRCWVRIEKKRLIGIARPRRQGPGPRRSGQTTEHGPPAGTGTEKQEEQEERAGPGHSEDWE